MAHYRVTGKAMCTSKDGDGFVYRAPQNVQYEVEGNNRALLARVALGLWIFEHPEFDDGHWIQPPGMVEVVRESEAIR